MMDLQALGACLLPSNTSPHSLFIPSRACLPPGRGAAHTIGPQGCVTLLPSITRPQSPATAPPPRPQVEELRTKHKIDVRVLGVAGQSGMLLSDTDINLENWQSDYKNKVGGSSLALLATVAASGR